MTTAAPPRQPSPTTSREETAVLDAEAGETILDTARFLPHRTRSRLCAPGTAPCGAYLVFQDGGQPMYLSLEETITHIGRGTSADVRIEEHRVSRDHAIVVRHGRYARLLDNRSANGTFLNGREVIATNLRDGDVIRLGPVVLQYVEIR